MFSRQVYSVSLPGLGCSRLIAWLERTSHFLAKKISTLNLIFARKLNESLNDDFVKLTILEHEQSGLDP